MIATQPKPKPTRGKSSGHKALGLAMEESYQGVLEYLDVRNPAKPDSPVLLLPMPPNIANARLHWRAKNKLKLRYFQMCDHLRCMKLIAPPWPNGAPELVLVHVTGYVKRRSDRSNFFARLKWSEDWLVKNGYAIDDCIENWEYIGMPGQILVSKSQMPPSLQWDFTGLIK